jgi:hypothetical protein
MATRDDIYKLAVEHRDDSAAFEEALRMLARGDAVMRYEELQNHFIDEDGDPYDAGEIDWLAVAATAGRLATAAAVAGTEDAG